MKPFQIVPPKEFRFEHSLSFLKRSPHEILHTCVDSIVTKLVSIDNSPVLFTLETNRTSHLDVEVLQGTVDQHKLGHYIKDWLDLNTDLKPFYQLAKKDKILHPIVEKYFGYRIVGQPDLFESLVWAIIGQQINLNFAYTLKKRFVEEFGERINHSGRDYYLFPTPEVVTTIKGEQLIALQFSRQKSNYIIGLGELFASGEVSKEKIAALDFHAAKEYLMKIKGIGNWTANYVLMKTFHFPDAFPLEDAGLHNAIKNNLELDRKPTLDEVRKLFKKYKGWEAYATLYLWKTL